MRQRGPVLVRGPVRAATVVPGPGTAPGSPLPVASRPGGPDGPARPPGGSGDRIGWFSSGSGPKMPKENTTDRRLRFVSDWCWFVRSDR